MTEQYQAAIGKVWKEALSTEEKLRLLEALTRDEAGWKTALQQQFQQDAQSGAQYLSAARSVQLLQLLHERIRLMDESATGMAPETKLVNMRTRIIRWATGAAAAILIIAGFFWYPSKKTNATFPSLALYKPVKEYQRCSNQTQQTQQFRLQDGSEVRLAPGSSIVHAYGFTNSGRTIQLAGEAWFDVAKDSPRPFSVTAGGVTTTALGTKFSMSSQRNRGVAVQLFEGKVKIEAVPGAKEIGTIILEPGQQCVIDEQLHAAVSKMWTDKAIAATTVPVTTEKSNTIKRMKPIEFVQTPLVDVLDQLGNRYHVHFRYDATELNNDQVTGTFLPSDELSVALKLLRSINNLSFSQYQDTIQVSKLK